MKLTISSAKEQLRDARQQQRELAKRILAFRTFLQAKGIDPDKRPDNAKRNRQIYEAWMAGEKLGVIGKRFNLSATTISNVAKRIYRKEMNLT